MKKTSIFIAITSAITLATSIASAQDMKKCPVIKNDIGLIKAMKADCATSLHSCAGQNPANEVEAWITVPKGQCTKINNGDFTGVSQKTKNKIVNQ